MPPRLLGGFGGCAGFCRSFVQFEAPRFGRVGGSGKELRVKLSVAHSCYSGALLKDGGQMPDPTMRFCAGSAREPSSAVWRVWAHRRDVYLGARISLGTYKISLHESGEWISALTSQSGARFDEIGSRRHRTWMRPSEFTPGWTQGPSLLIPWVHWVGDFPQIEKLPRDLHWIPGPPEHGKLTVTVLFAAPEVPPDSIQSVSQHGDHILGHLPLSNGETVWLQARWSTMSSSELRGRDSLSGEFQGFQTSGDINDVSPWALVVTTSELGIPLLVHFPLGHHHLTNNFWMSQRLN